MQAACSADSPSQRPSRTFFFGTPTVDDDACVSAVAILHLCLRRTYEELSYRMAVACNQTTI